jgi:hypothetical protein
MGDKRVAIAPTIVLTAWELIAFKAKLIPLATAASQDAARRTRFAEPIAIAAGAFETNVIKISSP